MTTNGALALIADAGLRDEIERIAAAAGIRVVYAAEPSGRKAWVGAAAVVLDVAAARRCRELGMPRRPAVFLIATDTPGSREFEAAMVIGAQEVITLPGGESALVGVLADAAAGESDGRRGAVVAVIGGRGGGGASVFAIALAQAAENRTMSACSSTSTPGAAVSISPSVPSAMPACAGRTWRRQGDGSAIRPCAMRSRAGAGWWCCRRAAPASS